MKHEFEIGDFVWLCGAPDLCGVVIEIGPDPKEPIVYRPVGGTVRGDIMVQHPRVVLTARPDELEWSLLAQLAWAAA